MILVTGAAGFIGFHVTRRLLARGDRVVAVDNLNEYYERTLKEARLEQLRDHAGFAFEKIDIADRAALAALFARTRPQRVVHLAAQAGVRYSLTNPHVYGASNLVGFLNVLEECRQAGVQHLVYASSSSVYGGNTQLPFSEHHSIDHPVSLYAATKRANELMAHTYSHLYRLPTTGLRFFTVYGPWGRPDMALFLFTKAILDDRPIQVFNHGNLTRDFTYVDDIAEGVVRVLDRVAVPEPGFDAGKPDPATSDAPFRLFNLGNSEPVRLGEMIEALEAALDKPAIKEYVDMQPGDVVDTAADTRLIEDWTGFRPHTPVREGVQRFVEWYREFYDPQHPHWTRLGARAGREKP